MAKRDRDLYGDIDGEIGGSRVYFDFLRCFVFVLSTALGDCLWIVGTDLINAHLHIYTNEISEKVGEHYVI